mmetsp:Transcript_4640/g.5542  ORF Transcript_4640/g.5542 Transcript_4640/m.5542 type:complete len:588 (-) Transcript_4640:619-2382(-)
MAKKFINGPNLVVEEMVSGTCAVHSDQLVRLDGFTVLLHRNIDTIKENQVTLLSGGGSGHEPAHAGYIGDGMLTAAVLGGVFASPSTTSVLAALRAIGGSHGVLMIVKNYTGDRINFGQAALQARAEGIIVEMVVVADDCALPEGKGVTGGRGVAGTVFVHKVAGAAAQRGLPLAEVTAIARRVAASVRTLGTAMTTCTVPGTLPSTRLDDETIEVGLGIHGEPGITQSVWKPALELVKQIVDVVHQRMPPPHRSTVESGKPRPVALMVNNLGGTPNMELYVVAHNALEYLRQQGLEPVRCMVGPFMTSLEMQGVSLSVLPLDVEDGKMILERLDMATSAPSWVVPSTTEMLTPLKPSGGPTNEIQTESHGVLSPEIVAAMIAACDELEASEPRLTAWDQVAGDGDCGITVQRGAVAVKAILPSLCGRSASSAYGEMAEAVAGSMGGTSGALLEIAFRAGRLHLIEQDRREDEGNSTQKVDYVGAFSAGVQAISTIGGAERGMRTMLDALMPAADELLSTGSWEAATRAAEEGADATTTMEGLAGRSNYVNAQLLMTVPDPGAKAVAIAMRAAFNSTTTTPNNSTTH